MAQIGASKLTLDRAKAYAILLKEKLQALMNDPRSNMPNDVEIMKEELKNSLDLIKDWGHAFTEKTYAKGEKFRAEDYNTLMDNIRLDLEVIYDQIQVVNRATDLISMRYGSVIERGLISIDELIAKIRNLQNLGDSWDNIDDIYYDAFSQDTNEYPDKDLAAINEERSGLIRLNTTNIDSIVDDEYGYDLVIDPMNKGIKTETNGSDPTSTEAFQHHETILTSLTSLSTNANAGTTSISYPGAAVGIIIQLPSVSIINSLSFSHISAGNLAVIGLFSSKLNLSRSTSEKWEPITDIVTDKFNIRSFDFTFDPIEVKTVMLLLGQPTPIIRKISSKEYTYIEDYNTLSHLMRQLGRTINKNNDDLITYYVPSNVVKLMDTHTKNVIASIIGLIESNLKINAEDDEADNAIKVYQYIVATYNLKIRYRKYNNASTYLSKQLNTKGDILAVQLATSSSKPTNTAIKCYIDIEGTKERIVSNDEDSIVDTYTIEDSSQNTINTDLLMNTANTDDTTVKINNILLDGSKYIINEIYTDAEIATGITIDIGLTLLNAGDFITIQYKPADVDRMLKGDNPEVVDILNKLGRPNLRVPGLHRGNTSRVATINQDDTRNIYNTSILTPEEVRPILMRDDGTISGDMEAIEIVPGYGFLSKKNASVFPPNEPMTVAGIPVYGVSGQYVQVPTRTIYKGIIKEDVIVSGSDLYTQNEYIPGTLHCEKDNIPLLIDEYVTASSAYNTFTLRKDYSEIWANPTDNILSSYIPMYSSNDEKVNLASYNASQLFFSTDVNNNVSLEYYPIVDVEILEEANNPLGHWWESQGSFIYKTDNNIVYEPIRVFIGKHRAIDRTDYISQAKVKLNEFNPRVKNYEFFNDGKSLNFNTFIAEQITVKYYAIEQRIRLKIDLVRLDKANDGVTPEVYDYGIFINRKE